MDTGMGLRRTLAVFLLAFLFCLTSPVQADAGLDWLLATAGDGALVGSAERVDPFTATAEALLTLHAEGAAGEAAVQSARDYLRGAERSSLPRLAASIRVAAAFGQPDAAEVSRLTAAQGRDLGFGEHAGSDAALVDSARALEALAVSGEARGQVAWDTLGYLLDRQRSDGAWGEGADESLVATTAAVLGALAPYRDWSDFGTQAAAARTFLLERRDADALWGETALSARVLSALIASGTPVESLADALAALRARQGSAGDWHGEVFATALALRALAASASPADATGAGGSGLGAISGTVVDGVSGLPIPAALVALSGPSAGDTVSGADGRFLLADLVSGDYTLQLSASGYATLSGAARIAPGQRADLGELRMLAGDNVTTATVRGEIIRADTKQPLSGVAVVVTVGADESWSTLTNGDGAFQLSGVTPGNASLQATLTGYSTANGGLSLVAGGAYLFSTALTPVDAPRTAIEGRVTDITTGEPIGGASIAVSGANDRLIRVSSDGSYRADNLAPGEMTLQVTADGYGGALTTLALFADNVVDFSPALYPSGGPVSAVNNAALTGVAVDLVSGVPLAGVQVVGTFATTTRSATTGADGRFSFDRIDTLVGSLALSLEGYEAVAFSTSLTPYATTDLGELPLLPSSALTLLPDLRVTKVVDHGLTTDPDTLLAAGTVRVELRNAGTAEVAGAVAVTLFYDADRDGVRDANETPLATGVIAPPIAAEGEAALELTVSAALPFRDAPLSAWVDSAEQVVETIEQNNVGTSAAACVAGDGSAQVDLSVAVPRVVEQGVGRFRLSARVGNAGGLGLSPGAGVSFYEGDPDGGGTLLGRVELPAIGASAYYDALLADVVIGGAHPIVAVADADETVAECDESNNRAAVRAPDLKPDLVVRAIDRTGLATDLGDLALSGELTVTVANDGSFAADGAVAVRAYLDGDRDGLFGAGDTLLGERRIELALAVGERLDFTLPLSGSLPFRDAAISVELDSADELPEREEGNNVAASDALACTVASSGRTYTLSGDFAEGEGINLNTAVPDQLSLDDATEIFPFIWVPASGRGTIVKIDTTTGEILGEYLSSPSGRGRNPSRTTVDKDGSVWAGNRDESSAGRGSVVKVGLAENGQCVDRNGNGVIDTSTGLGDVRPWENPNGVDDNGGVSSAEGECILHYVRVEGDQIRHVSVDENNNVWTAGNFGADNAFDLIDGETGEILSSFDVGCGGYGGMVDPDGVIWSANRGWGPHAWLRYHTQGTLTREDDYFTCTPYDQAYGIGVDHDGNVWGTHHAAHRVSKHTPDGAYVGTYLVGGSFPRGLAATPDNFIWIANSGSNSVSVIHQGGWWLGGWLVGKYPTGVAADSSGKVWVANRDSDNVMRINPATWRVDRVVDLGQGAAPYTYGDMTGSLLLGAPDEGTWTVVHDGGEAGADWGGVRWSADLPADAALGVEISAGEDGVHFGPVERAESGRPIAATGRYLQVRVHFSRASSGESPVLHDLTVDTAPAAAPDLSAALLAVVDRGADAAVDLRLRVGNAGTLATPAGVAVAFRQGELEEGGAELGRLTLDALAPGEYRDLTLVGVRGFDPAGAPLQAAVDAEALLAECDELNNRVWSPIADSTLGRIEVAVNAPAFGAHEPVALLATVSNGGALSGRFDARLVVEAPDGRAVATFPYRDQGTLAGGAVTTFSEGWNSADYLAGEYTLRGVVRGAEGEVQGTASTTFRIHHPDPVSAELRVTTDRPVYHTHDSVELDSLVRNLTANVLIDDARLALAVHAPGGEVVFSRTLTLGQLVPNGERDLVTPYKLIGAAEGGYRVSGVLTSGGDTLAEAEAAFTVAVNLERSLTGEVTAQHARRYIGEPQSCTDRVANGSALDLDDLPVRQALLRLDNESVVTQTTGNIALTAGARTTLVREVSTAGLAAGDYACVLQVYLDSKRKWVTLGRALFRLDPPPIVIDATLDAAPRGRLLVLLDDPAGAAAPGGRDPHGVAEAADLATQRAWLEAALRDAGWSYTLVTSAADFVREQRSGGYGLYLLHAEQIHLDVDAQRALREAVRAGDGLVVGGDHDQRNARLDAALGIAFRGTLSADGLLLADRPTLPFASPRAAARVTLEGTVSLAHFNPGGEPAITHHPFGAGEAVHIGFDLLAEAAAGGAAGEPLGALLLGALAEVDPQPAARAGGPLAVRLALVNQGIAIPGVATLALPAGVGVLDAGDATVEEAALRWTFDLAEAQSATFDAWLRLPPAGGPLTLTAAIETGSAEALALYDTVEWSVSATPPATIAEAQGLLESAGLANSRRVRVERDL
ncbi:carboxypeptidase regulatory-like domain-containing protein, partial [Endothiovibrio diazotrophicus]